MIKVQDVNPYKKTTYNHNDFDSEVDVLVAEGELVLVKSIGGGLVMDGNDVLHVNDFLFLTGNGFSLSTIKLPATYYRPILISRTEEVRAGNLFYHTDRPDKIGVAEEDLVYPYCKVLALSEHFSPEQLQLIADGKLKDGQKVLVECEQINDEETIAKASGFSLKVPVNIQYQIKLNPHITIYPIPEEKKMYTKEEVKEYFYQYLHHIRHEINNKRDPLYYSNIDNWVEENVK